MLLLAIVCLVTSALSAYYLAYAFLTRSPSSEPPGMAEPTMYLVGAFSFVALIGATTLSALLYQQDLLGAFRLFLYFATFPLGAMFAAWSISKRELQLYREKCGRP